MASKDSNYGKQANPDVSVIVVSYNGKDELADCLHSVLKETRCVSFEVIVSDNDSKDGCLEMIRSRFPSVRILENKANLGFAAANNKAFDQCAGRYILLLNPDTLLQSDAISRMVSFMDENPKVGLCGPRLLNADGSLQHSARNFPSVANHLAESLLLDKIFPNSERLGELIRNPKFYFFSEDQGEQFSSSKKPFDDGEDKRGKTENRMLARHVDWVTGAALMIRRETFKDIGPLDERYFMYSEEKDWCFGAHRKRWLVVFYPGAEIVHLHGDSGTNPELFKMLVHSKLLFLMKNYAPFRARTIVAMIHLNLAIKFALCWVAMAVAGIISRSSVRDRLLRRFLVLREGLSLLSHMVFVLVFCLALNAGLST